MKTASLQERIDELEIKNKELLSKLTDVNLALATSLSQQSAGLSSSTTGGGATLTTSQQSIMSASTAVSIDGNEEVKKKEEKILVEIEAN